jgi:hypothetical protein
MLGAHRLRSVANRSSRRRQSRMAFGWFAMRTRRRRSSASPVGGAPSGGGSAHRSRWRPRRPGQTDSKRDESTVVRPRREITSITTSRWAHQCDVTHSAAGVFVSASQRGRRGAPTRRPSETILGARNYPNRTPTAAARDGMRRQSTTTALLRFVTRATPRRPSRPFGIAEQRSTMFDGGGQVGASRPAPPGPGSPGQPSAGHGTIPA